jgi:cell division protease FtsH
VSDSCALLDITRNQLFWTYIMAKNKPMWQFSLFGQNISFGCSNTKLKVDTEVKTTLAALTIAEEAKAKVQNIVDFLKSSAGFQGSDLNRARVILVVGQTSADRTLLASVFAGECQLPFFSIEGSDFVDDFPAVAVLRLHELFKQARKSVASVIFIDDIDLIFPLQEDKDAIKSDGKKIRDQLLSEIGIDVGQKRLLLIAGTTDLEMIDSHSLCVEHSNDCLRIEHEQNEIIVKPCQLP